MTRAAALLALLVVTGTALAEPIDRSTPAEAVLLQPPAPCAIASEADSVIASMVAQVSQDSIHAFLERLTGEVSVPLSWGTVDLLSRYSSAVGNEHAAEFLAGVFAGYGYDVEMDYFSFPHGLEDIHVDPTGANLCVGSQGRILHSGDLSVWTRTRSGIEDATATVRGLDRVAGDTFVAVGNSGFIAVTGDAGASWSYGSTAFGGRLNGVAVEPSGLGWAVGKIGKILRTTDTGATWAPQPTGTTSMLYGVHAFSDTEVVVVGAGGTILRTTDGGSTWTAVTSGTTEDLFGLDFTGDLGWAVGGTGTALHTTDRGASWTAQSSGTTRDLNAVSFADASTGWTVGGLSTVLRTTDGGVTWVSQPIPVVNTNLRAALARSSSEAWVTGVSGTLLRTTDGGASWESQHDRIEDGWANVVATLPGRSAPQEEVLLVGHFDSISGVPETLAPGADDNGSGVAAIVESARQLINARYDRTIRFVCLSGEEIGLLGSDAYAAQAQTLGTQIVGVFNLDAVGWNDNYFRIFSDDFSTWLGDVAANMAATHAPGLTTFHWYCPGCNWSDHWSFWQHGFEAIVGIETWDPAPPQHHTVGDTLGLMDMPLVADVTRIALSTIATVARVDTTVQVAAPLALGSGGDLRLSPSFPNPSSGSVSIWYEIPRALRVRLRVYDVAGRLVTELLNARREAGAYTATWTGHDAQGQPVAPGIYFCRLEAGSRATARSVAIVR